MNIFIDTTKCDDDDDNFNIDLKTYDNDNDNDNDIRMRITNRKYISTGEKLCNRILFDMKIDYFDEYSFDSLPNRRFDFKFHFNNLPCVIEIDGPQHFNYNELGHKIKHKRFFYICMNKYIEHQNSDIIKTIFCINHNISCLRIHYSYHSTHHKMKNIILNFLHNIKLSNKPVYMLSHPEHYNYLYNNDVICTKIFI